MSTDATVELNTETTLTDEAIEALVATVENSVEVPLKRQWHCEAALDPIRHWSGGSVTTTLSGASRIMPRRRNTG